MQMQAARFHHTGGLTVEEVAIPQIGAQEVLVRVRYCGICGTDTHIVAGHKGSTPVTPPRILGHEFSGDVVEVGKDVTHVKVGDRVAADVNYSCGHCEACARGERHLCDDMQGVGTALDGGFAQYVKVPAVATFVLPVSVTHQEAAMIEPLSCCLHGIDRLGISVGDHVAIVGAGMIGLLMQQLVRLAGAARVFVIETQEGQRQSAAALGADLVIDPLTQDACSVIRDAGFSLPAVVVDCAGTVKSAESSIQIAARGATVMFFGLTAPDDTIEIRPFEIFQKELTLTSSFVNPWAYGRALRLLESGAITLDGLVTQVLPLEDINAVFTGPPVGGKTLIKVSHD